MRGTFVFSKAGALAACTPSAFALAACTAGALALAVGCSSGTSGTGSTGDDTTDQSDVGGGGGENDTGGGADVPDSTEGPGADTDQPDGTEQVDVPDPEDVPVPPDAADDTAEPDTGDPGDVTDPPDVEVDLDTIGTDTSTDDTSTDDTSTDDIADTTAPLACGATGEFTFPGEVTGETFEGATSALGIEPDMCPGNLFSPTGGTSPDNVWVFTAPADGAYEFTLTPSDTFDSALYVLTDCTPSADTCLGSDDNYGSGAAETVTVTLTAHQAVYVVVDGWTGDSESTPEFGTYTLSVVQPCVPQCDGKTCGADGCGGQCGLCDAGTGCSTDGTACEVVGAVCKPASTIECGQSVDLLDSSSAKMATAAFETYSCQVYSSDTYSGNEVSVSFTAPAGNPVNVSVTSDDSLGLDLIVIADDGAGCALSDGNCVTSGFSGATFTTTPGATYYLVWDGPSFADANPNFGMKVDCCTPSCDGKTCGDDGCGGSCGSCEAGYCTSAGQCSAPITTCVGQGEIACGDTLTGLASDAPGLSQAFNSYSCQMYPNDNYSGPELVYSFKALANERVTFKTTNASGFALTLLEDYGAGCADGEGTCLGQGFGSLTADVVAGKTYYVVLDSYNFGFSGKPTHDIELATSCCEPVCAAGTCGDDGCGGTCACTGGEFCSAGLCGVAPAGEICASAIDLGTVTEPATAVGDTTGTVDNFPGGCSGLGEAFNAGEGGDLVYSFTTGMAGDYSFALTNGANGPYQLSVLSDCGAFACLDGYDYYFGGEPLVVPLDAGTTYFVAIDSGYYDENGAFTFSITPPVPNP